MADKKPAIKYTVLPADHPLLATLARSNGFRLSGPPAGGTTNGTAGGIAILPRAGGQVRILQAAPGQVFPGTADGTAVQRPAGNSGPVRQIFLSAGGQPANVAGQVIRLQNIQQGQKSVIVGGQQLRLVQTQPVKAGAQQLAVQQGQQLAIQQGQQLAVLQGQQQTAKTAVLQPRIQQQMQRSVQQSAVQQTAVQQTAVQQLMYISNSLQQQNPQQIRLAVQQGKHYMPIKVV